MMVRHPKNYAKFCKALADYLPGETFRLEEIQKKTKLTNAEIGHYLKITPNVTRIIGHQRTGLNTWKVLEVIE